MTETLHRLNADLLLFFNSYHQEWCDNFMLLFTDRFTWIPLYVFIVGIIIHCYGWRRAPIIFVGVALTITLADQLCASVLRPMFKELRPSNPENPLSEFVTVVNGYRGGRYGFPSCHAANTFALTAFLYVIIPKRKFLVFTLVWALMNCYSRMYLGVHYPGDILAGAAIGSVIGYGVARSVEAVLRRIGNSEGSHKDAGFTYKPFTVPIVKFNGSEISFYSIDTGIAAGIGIIIVIGVLAFFHV